MNAFKFFLVLLLLLLPIILLFTCFASGINFTDTQLYEGDNCTLENETEIGVCKKLQDCQPIMQDVKEGRRASNSPGRCGFEHFIEIVCCPRQKNVTNVTNLGAIKEVQTERLCEHACSVYRHFVPPPPRPRKSGFGTVVFNGIRAEDHEFPFAVALGELNDDSGQFSYLCAGTLISPLHVLTAAHCVRNLDEKAPTHAMAGTTSLTKPDFALLHTTEVAQITVHPRYRRTRNYFDVAIIKLEDKAPLTIAVRPACLYTKPLKMLDPLEERAFVAIGWGATSFDIDVSDTLMKTRNLSLVDTATCAPPYKDFAQLPTGLDDTLVCAIDLNSTNRSDACHGDSGGPFLMYTHNDTILAGVTAFGQACASDFPAVYTGVYKFLDWIEDNVWKNISTVCYNHANGTEICEEELI